MHKSPVSSQGIILPANARTLLIGGQNGVDAGEYEYQVPIFVLTRHPPARHPKEGSGLTFTFVGDGLDRAVTRARDAAGDRQATVVGGATLIQSLLRRGAVDELPRAPQLLSTADTPVEPKC